jgi:transposase InsO family protein
MMCKVLDVTRSSYYHWMQSEYPKEDIALDKLIQETFLTSRQTYGTRRLKKQLLKDHGLVLSRRRIAKVMKRLSLNTRARRKFRVSTTNSNHNYQIAPNRLDQYFITTRPDEVYVGDITYIPTKQGWLYLATVIDLYSRKVVGWSMDERMTSTLVNDALLMAIKSRRPSPGLISHTDRGSQYASDSHKELLKEHGILQSMSRKGNCYDNAVAESFFHSLKTELTHHIKFETRSQANQAIFDYIEVFYNRKRLHSTNNYMSPVDFENQLLLNDMSA